ncbi:MAG: thymidine kinase [Lentimicrobiaceae bacterium]|nr:thymidine kinase [Lentimicrobiaceae bacterium]
MFIEKSNNTDPKKGWIEVIAGSMFSGKTEELLRRLKRAKIARQRIEIFKPAVDTRYEEDSVVSHDQNSIKSIPISNSAQILFYVDDVDVVGIDEAQFFDSDLPVICKQIADSGKRVIIAGLDMDFMGKPFGPMPTLMAQAEFVTKVQAICVRCGDIALHSYRKISNDKLVVLGEKESYEPLCRSCYNKAIQSKH